MSEAPATILIPSVQRDWIGIACAGLIGAMAWAFWVDPAVLDPTNVDWLLVARDRGVNYIGWAFFRDTPWGMPPGINPRYGIELSSSVVYSDSIPLLALPLKLLGGLLPNPFQYLGPWLLACAMLQGLFGYLLARRLGAGMTAAIVVSAFCVAAPVLPARLDHFALMAHWTLLAAFFLYFGDRARLAAWPVLLGIVAAIHPYLFAMVLAIYCAHVAKRWGKVEGRQLLIEAFLAASVSVAVTWSIGLFVGASPEAGGFGHYKHDLLGLIDPDQFSRLWPDIPSGNGAYEGYAFLGIGTLALGLLALPSAGRWRGVPARGIWPLALVVAAMFVFSLSTTVDLAGTPLFRLPLPEALEELAGIFRSSGRFVWPAVYLLTIACVLGAIRLYPDWGLAMAVACLALQAFDMAPGMEKSRERASVIATAPETISPVWSVLARDYSRVRAIPVRHPGFEWHYASRVAVEHGMSTDSVYLARVPPLAEASLRAEEALGTGAFDNDAVYILDEAARDAAEAQASPDDLLTIIDGRFIFAPDGCVKLPELCRSGTATLRSPLSPDQTPGGSTGSHRL